MKTLHFVSHSHWDREWYMPFQNHRMKLVELMDSLLETLDNDESFKCFYLDGQVLVIEDYLEVKPEMKDKIKKYIAEGRIKFGPWFILQDEYLISAESNVRNMLYGLKQARRYGEPSRIGYLPDSFGNISQMPQIFNGFDIDNAVFGRGINPIGFNNEVKESENEGYNSEVKWKSPDGSEVLGILMANWYSNGNEVPLEEKEAIEFINKKKKDAELFATTSHLLLMNGCDHQPVQTNIGQILEKVQPNFEDKLIHSNLVEYIKAVKSEVSNLKTVEGELNSQLTDGWWTLSNTASSRLYLKRLNYEAQTLLENYVEPFELFAWLEGKKYNDSFVWLAYRYLLQNHPHDSICGCSVDEVHEEMVIRFKNSMQNSNGLIHESLNYIFNIDDKDLSKANIYVYNGLNWNRSEIAEVTLDIPQEENLNNIVVVDENNNEYPVDIEDKGVVFTYTLPKDSFRKVKYVHRYIVRFLACDIPCYGFKKFTIKEIDEKKKDNNITDKNDSLSFENKFYKVVFNKDGSFNMLHKSTNKEYRNFNVYENGADVGNEYIYKAPENDIISTTRGKEAKIEKVKDTAVETVFKITQSINAPENWTKGENNCASEQMGSIEFETYVAMNPISPMVSIKVNILNNCKDHRVRTLFPTEIKSDYHYAESQFDVIRRNTTPWEGWKNPSNCQKQLKFVDVSDENKGLMVINKGLPEYEVLRDGKNTIALTILRCTSELGDWGDFPTPEAQCLGKNIAEYAIMAHEGNYINAYREAYNFNVGVKAVQSSNDINNNQLFNLDSKTIVTSAVKKCEDRESMIIRLFNISDIEDTINVKLNKTVKEVYLVNLEEIRKEKLEIRNNSFVDKVGKKQIKTYEIVF